jgi:hypothetical protein
MYPNNTLKEAAERLNDSIVADLHAGLSYTNAAVKNGVSVSTVYEHAKRTRLLPNPDGGNFSVGLLAPATKKSIGYRARVRLPEICTAEDAGLEFSTKTGLIVAHGYVRVEFGGRGPYIEFRPDQMVQDAIHYIQGTRHIYFHEYRTNDEANVMLYLQRRSVAYAVYHPGLWYASPSELVTTKYDPLVLPLPNSPALRVAGEL